MDKNSVIGTVLICLLLVGYYWFTKPTEADLKRRAEYLDSLRNVELQKQIQRQEDSLMALQVLNDTTKILIDSAINESALMREYGSFYKSAQGEEEFVTLENNLIAVTLSSKGAKPYRVQIKNYTTHSGDSLFLLAGDSTHFGLLLSEIGRSTDEMYFVQNQKVSKADPVQKISYRLSVNEFSYLEYTYTLRPDSYNLELSVSTKGMEKYIRESRYNLLWNTTMNVLEKSKSAESQNTTVVWKYFEDDTETLNPRSKDDEKEKLSGQVKWVGFKQHFFSAVLIADDKFERGGDVTSKVLTNSSTTMKEFTASLFLAKEQKIDLKFFFGPNHLPVLKEQNIDLESMLDLGWFGFITKYAIVPIFNWLRGFIDNMGVVILLMTIILKLVLFPLTCKSYLSTARMRVIKPYVEEINEKYPKPEDAMKKQQATMDLYKKVGINPMGGCLPILIQFPILVAMFRFFPASIELRQESFLWADDLSTYDSIFEWSTHIPLISSIYGNHISLFTLLMAASMIVVNKINTANTAQMQTPGMPNMNVMMWMMSIMMIFWFNDYSAGLSYYYLLANVITMLQTVLIRNLIDDEKILKKLEANKAKAPKRRKSSFQERLERLAKEQQKQLRK
ncbi:MAG: membrane protein insertase YidC [Bacteroidales bacterium]|nr:membrane protein insertase YidC [Bacteroidales bacterium]